MLELEMWMLEQQWLKSRLNFCENLLAEGKLPMPRDRVRMTKKALEQCLDGKLWHGGPPSSKGVVISVTRTGFLRVLRDNRKTVESYHPSFWENTQELFV